MDLFLRTANIKWVHFWKERWLTFSESLIIWLYRFLIAHSRKLSHMCFIAINRSIVAHVVISDELLRLEVRFKTACCQVHFLDSLHLSRERRIFVPIYTGGILNPRSHFTRKVYRSTWVCKHDLLRFTSFLCILYFSFHNSLCLDLPVESFDALFSSLSFIDIFHLFLKFLFHLGFIFLNV